MSKQNWHVLVAIFSQKKQVLTSSSLGKLTEHDVSLSMLGDMTPCKLAQGQQQTEEDNVSAELNKCQVCRKANGQFKEVSLWDITKNSKRTRCWHSLEFNFDF